MPASRETVERVSGEAVRDPERREPGKKVRRADGKSEGTPLSIDHEALARVVGQDRTETLSRRFRSAARAYENGRYRESLPLLRRLTEEAPGFAQARELYGLNLYALGRWDEAIVELEAMSLLTQSYSQYPAIADCHRAMARWSEVERVWDALRELSPEAEVMAEGRIVAAGALADQGKMREAIDLLARSFRPPVRPKEFHLRRMYALADLYERAGDVPSARDLFRRIAQVDPDFYDAVDRVRNLG